MSDEEDDKSGPVLDPGAAKKPRGLTKEEWEEVIAHYEYGTLSPNEIWAKYDVTASAISHKFKALAKKGRLIVKNSKAHLRAAKTAATAPAAAAKPAEESTFDSKRRKRIEQTKETLFQQSFLHQKTLLALQQNLDKGVAAGTHRPADFDGDMKTMKRIADNIAAMVETRWKLLDIDKDIDEKSLPVLVFEDLTEEEIKTMQARSADEDDDGDDMDDFDLEGDAASTP